MYSAEIDLPAVPAEKNLELKSRGDEQSPDIRFAQENVAGGMAAAVGAANTAEAQSPGVERTFPALGTPVNISLVNGSVERKDGSLLPGPLVGDKKTFSAKEKVVWGEKDSNLRRLSQQIYSLPPLTTREPPHSWPKNTEWALVCQLPADCSGSKRAVRRPPEAPAADDHQVTGKPTSRRAHAAALGDLESVQDSQDPAAVAPVVVLAVDGELVVDVEGRTLGIG
jgi:hypothetical protein